MDRTDMFSLIVTSLVILSSLVCYTSSQIVASDQQQQADLLYASLLESASPTPTRTKPTPDESPWRQSMGCTDNLKGLSLAGCAGLRPTADKARVICVPLTPSTSTASEAQLPSAPCRVLPDLSQGFKLPQMAARGSGVQRRNRGFQDLMAEADGERSEAGLAEDPSPLGGSRKSSDAQVGGGCGPEDGIECAQKEDYEAAAASQAFGSLLKWDGVPVRRSVPRSQQRSGEGDLQEIIMRYLETSTGTRGSGNPILPDEPNLRALRLPTGSRQRVRRLPLMLVKLMDDSGVWRRLLWPDRGMDGLGSEHGLIERSLSSSASRPPPINRVHRSELVENGTAQPAATLVMGLTSYPPTISEMGELAMPIIFANASGEANRVVAGDGGSRASSDFEAENRYEPMRLAAAAPSGSAHDTERPDLNVGAVEPPPDCRLHLYRFRAEKSDGLGNTCTGYIGASICYGACQTGEISDWLFPYKKSIHKVCTHGSRVRRRAILSTCSSANVDPSLREYHYTDALSCSCSKCSSADTICTGSISSASLKPQLQN